MKKYKFHQLNFSGLSSSILLPGLLFTSLLLSGCGILPEAEKIQIDAMESNTLPPTGNTTPPASTQQSKPARPVATLQAKPTTPAMPQNKPAPVKRREAVRQAKTPPKQPATQPKPTIKQANRLMQQGQRAAAADMYYRASFSYPSPQRERIMLQAAEISASLGNKQRTANYLQKTPVNALTPLNKIRYHYIQSLLALHNQQPDQALSLLPANTARLPKGLRDKIELVRERAIAMGGYPANQQQLSRQTSPQQLPQNQAQQPQTAPAFALPRSTNKIAVLLPHQGSLGKVGDEIYQGIKQAQARYGNAVLSKRYDVDKNNVISQYQQAVNDGADIVVGPLDKDSLAALTTQPQLLQVPVLSLNYLPGANNLPHTLYQFGLSPEDEARQIANFALQRGQQNGIMMTPDSAWGKRLADAFAQTYQQQGGRILHAEFYPNASPSTYLQRVQTLLANAQGANMVFLAASPTQARLLRPLLKDQAGILPVYATSHIFSGRTASNQDIDLDGIIYTEIPYILNKTGQGSLDNLQFPRLYALGMDAVTVARNLAPLVQRQVVPGQTGQISMAPQRRLQRRLQFATFINGQPHSLDQ